MPRTRANPSPGGLKSLDDVKPPKPSRKRPGRKAASTKVANSIETSDNDENTVADQGSHSAGHTLHQSPPTNTSRSQSLESHSQSSQPIESRSTSPPAHTTATSNEASSDNDASTQPQPQHVAPLGSNRKRSRVGESTINPKSPGTPDTKQTATEQRSVKRARFDDSQLPPREEDAEFARMERRIAEGRAAYAARQAARKVSKEVEPAYNRTPRSQSRGRKQAPEPADNDSSADDDNETPVRSRSRSSSRKSFASPRPYQTSSSSAKQAEKVIPKKTDVADGPPSNNSAAGKLALPAPALKPGSKNDVPFNLRDMCPPDGDHQAAFAIEYFGIEPTFLDKKFNSKTDRLRAHYAAKIGLMRQREQEKTAAASSSEILFKNDSLSPARRSPDELVLTDSYLVAVAKAFTDHKDQSKPLPPIEDITAFLTYYETEGAEQPLQLAAAAHKESSALVNYVDADMVDSEDGYSNDGQQDADEPRTPAGQSSPLQDSPSPTPIQSRPAWKKPFEFVSNILTSPFRRQPQPPPSTSKGPYQLDYKPPTSPTPTRRSRAPQTARGPRTRRGHPGRAIPQSERAPRAKFEQYFDRSHIMTDEEVRIAKQKQDEEARRMGWKLDDDLQTSRRRKRNANIDRDEKEAMEQAKLRTPVKTGEKRGRHDETPPTSSKPWNLFLSGSPDSSDDDDDDDDDDDSVSSPTPSGPSSKKPVYTNTSKHFMSLTEEQKVLKAAADAQTLDYKTHHYYSAATSYYLPAGPMNRLAKWQLDHQRDLRNAGTEGIYPEWMNDLEYLDWPEEEPERKPLHLPGNMQKNIDEGLPVDHVRPKENKPINIFAQASTPVSKSRSGPFRVPDDSDEEEEHDVAGNNTRVAEGSRILEPKQWTQVPPPASNQKPSASMVGENAVPSASLLKAMNSANKYLPKKPSGLRETINMSPLQSEHGDSESQQSSPIEWSKLQFDVVVDDVVQNALDNLTKTMVIPPIAFPQSSSPEPSDSTNVAVSAMSAAQHLFGGI